MPDPEVVRVMRQFKRDLLRLERAQLRDMAQRWLTVERRLQAQIDALALEMADRRRDGRTITAEMLLNERRYRELLVQLTQELERYSDQTEVQITAQQRRLARLGVAHAENALTVQGVSAGFNRLPVESVELMAGLAGNGAPLRQLLVQSWPLAADGLTNELVTGVALGYNPRKVARMMAQGATGSLDRMMVIARTEQLRVYRFANRESYRTSGVVTGYKRLATHDSRVCAACLMDEGTLYEVGEEMPEHPQGRCTMVPVVEGMRAPTWTAGADWFALQSPERQRAILGQGRYGAWQAGDFDLGAVVTVRPNATWGASLQVTPLRELVGA